MKAIILAAGMGNRIGEITKNCPKALITVANIPLIMHVIQFARLFHPDEIVVVGGFNSKMLWDYLVDKNITPVENPAYKNGNFYSLNCARPYLNDGFIQLNTDHIYPHRMAHLIEDLSDGIFLVSDFDRRLYSDDMKITIDGQIDNKAKVTSISKDLSEYDGGYCGITIVKGSGVEPYISAMDMVMEENNDQAVVEDIISKLILKGSKPDILDISSIGWLEIDTPEDLQNAERILRMKPNFLD